MPKQNPGERPTRKIMAAAAGEVPKDRRRIVRTKPAAPAMPDQRFHMSRAASPAMLAIDPSEIDDTSEE